jgi:hypothetical protein
MGFGIIIYSQHTACIFEMYDVIQIVISLKQRVLVKYSLILSFGHNQIEESHTP